MTSCCNSDCLNEAHNYIKTKGDYGGSKTPEIEATYCDKHFIILLENIHNIMVKNDFKV